TRRNRLLCQSDVEPKPFAAAEGRLEREVAEVVGRVTTHRLRLVAVVAIRRLVERLRDEPRLEELRFKRGVSPGQKLLTEAFDTIGASFCPQVGTGAHVVPPVFVRVRTVLADVVCAGDRVANQVDVEGVAS